MSYDPGLCCQPPHSLVPHCPLGRPLRVARLLPAPREEGDVQRGRDSTSGVGLHIPSLPSRLYSVDCLLRVCLHTHTGGTGLRHTLKHVTLPSPQVSPAAGGHPLRGHCHEAAQSGHERAAAHFLLPGTGHAPHVSDPHLQVWWVPPLPPPARTCPLPTTLGAGHRGSQLGRERHAELSVQGRLE